MNDVYLHFMLNMKSNYNQHTLLLYTVCLHFHFTTMLKHASPKVQNNQIHQSPNVELNDSISAGKHAHHWNSKKKWHNQRLVVYFVQISQYLIVEHVGKKAKDKQALLHALEPP